MILLLISLNKSIDIADAFQNSIISHLQIDIIYLPIKMFAEDLWLLCAGNEQTKMCTPLEIISTPTN